MVRYRPMPSVSVDRPCDVHFIEAWCRGMDEVVHCVEWDRVRKVKRGGVVVMDCPQPECCPRLKDIDRKCNLGGYDAG